MSLIEFGGTRDAEGRREAIPFATLLSWNSGNTLDIPKLTMAKRGGWVYKPEGMWTKKDKHFGRGEIGRARAYRYLTDLVYEAFEEHDNELPTFAGPAVSKNDGKVTSGYYSRFSASYQWESKYGYVGAALKQSGGWLEAHVTLPTTLLIGLYPRESFPVQKHAITFVINVCPNDKMNSFVQRWMDNPWKSLTFFPNINESTRVPGADSLNVANAKLARLIQLIEPVKPFEPDWTEAAESYRDTTDGNGWDYSMDSSFMLKSTEYRTEVLTHATRKAVEQLKNVLSEYGVDMRLETTREHEFRSLSFDIEATAGTRHNKEGHQFVIRPNGIEVVCGFVTDEENYVNHQSRQAIDEIAEMLQE